MVGGPYRFVPCLDHGNPWHIWGMGGLVCQRVNVEAPWLSVFLTEIDSHHFPPSQHVVFKSSHDGSRSTTHHLEFIFFHSTDGWFSSSLGHGRLKPLIPLKMERHKVLPCRATPGIGLKPRNGTHRNSR